MADCYVIERELGRGGMATVYLAHDLKHDRSVALKVLHPELAATLGPERFLREIRTTARLDHPHILPLFDSGEAQGLLWYTMPYVEGASLRERLRRDAQLPADEALRVTGEVADALDYAHRHAIVHRDIKPENILLGEGHARVADFGVARAVEAAGGGKLTETGLAVGTPAYMAPEQASAGQVDARSDVYALGCVLYEMLAGEPPYAGPTAQALIAKRLSEPVPHLGSVRAVPPGVEAAVTRALAKVPADRFATAGEFAAALRAGASLTAAPVRQAARTTRARLALVLGGLLVLAVLAGLYGLWRHSSGRQTAESRKAPATAAVSAPATASGPSVAVLPFTNLSPERENEYFADGMTEELITALGRVSGLRVAARTSAFAFKGKNADVREIGQRLNVGTVVEGSVRRAGHRLRVTAQLINVADGYHLWADEYDRELRDVFQVQDELARAIVGALRVPLQLPNRSDTALVKAGTADPAAHDLYLQGRQFWNQRTPSSLQTAARYFERAIAKDSSYAEAYVGLAEVFVLLPIYEADVPPGGAFARARAAALRALALDSTLGSAHATLGYVRMLYDWDWPGAEREFRQAIALTPSYPTAHQWYAYHLASLGRSEEALAEIELARRLDPLSRIINSGEGDMLYYSRRYNDAIAQLRRTLDLDPDFIMAHVTLGSAYLAKGMHAEAVAELETAARLTARRQWVDLLAYAYAAAGQRDRVSEIVRELTERSRREHTPLPSTSPFINLALADTAQALASLERAVDRHEPWMVVLLATEPLFDPLRSAPRFTRLLERVGLKMKGLWQ